MPNVKILSLSNIKKITPGQPDKITAKAMVSYLEKAIELAKKGEIQAIVTGPITKEGLSLLGLPYKGHTDWLAKEFQVKDYVMTFYSEKLIVSLVTIHIPLKEVPFEVSKEKVKMVCKLSFDFLKRLGKEGKIAVCGLNPHAGEKGVLGKEELEVIAPAVKELQTEGFPVYGPFPGDVIFHKVLKGDFDLVVAMYHDQGLAPFKLVAFEDGVNVTLGLPVVRTSPCHGTAYDIAGKGIASHKSFLSALKLAKMLIH